MLYLNRPFSPGGIAILWGQAAAKVPGWGAPILLQFRVWPAEFATYEDAVASSVPSPPVGVSDVVPAIPSGWIVENTIQIGPLWLSPVRPTNVLSPSLTCTLAPGFVTLSWPTDADGFTLVGATSLSSNADWSPVAGTVLVTNRQVWVSVPITNGTRFLRLRR